MFSTTFIALKYIKSKKKPFLPSLSFLTSFLGIFLSIFTLVATISIMDGFKEEFERTIIGVRPHIKLYFPAFNQLQPEEIMDYKQKSQNLMQIQNINYANGGLSGEAMLKPEKGKGFSGVLFSALEIEDFLKKRCTNT